MKGRVLPVAAAVLLTACATTIGTQFARPPADAVRLGETTGEQVVAQFGKPQDEKRYRADGQLLRTMAYYFGSETEPAKDPGAVCFRRLVFVLSDDTVIRETFESSCVADHTDFDERKASEIVKSKTRCEDAIAIMGRPNSRGIDPAGGKKGQLGIGYLYSNFARSVDTAKPYRKELELLCDPDGIVREMSFREFGSR
jgi:hypothetical protein